MRRILTIFFLSLALVSNGQSILRARIYPYASASGYVPVSYDSAGYNVLFKLPVSSILGAGGSGGGEPVITAPSTTKKYWTGYKTWGSMNSDSLVEGVTNLFYTNTRVQTFGDGRYLQPSAITGKLNISDTSSMLSAYLTAILSRVKYTDTAAMLSNYKTSMIANAANVALKVNISDTAAMLANYLSGMIARVKYSDTASMLSNYRTGMIANTSNIALKVNISDTSAMLSNYLSGILSREKYSDTASMLNNYRTGMTANTANILLKVNISDTASMLNNYRTGMLARVKYTDTSGMLANYLTGFLARVKYTDTAAMLANYARAFNYYTKAQIDGSGFLTQNNTISFAPTGDVTGSTTGQTTLAPALSIGANKVTLAMMAQVATATFLGRTTAATGNVEALTGTQATALLDAFTTSAKGLVPSPGGTSNTTDFLRRDGVWAAPVGGSGTVTSVSIANNNGFAGSVANATTTPAITLTTSVTGLLKGNGTAMSAASSGSDYTAGTAGLATGILKNTTTTGALSIAVAGDFPILNQNTTGTAANITGVLNATSHPALTGDVTNTSGTVATTISANVVTDAKLRQGSALSIIGRSANSTGNVADIASTVNNQVLSNKGSVLGFNALGGQTSIVAASAGINTTETILTQYVIPANTMIAGTTYRIVAFGTCTSTVANASNFRVRLGTAGTTSDPIVAVVTPTAAASGSSVPFQIVLYVTIRTTGAGSGTTAGSGALNNNGTTGVSAAADVVGAVTTTSALNTTIQNTLSLTYSSAATTTTSTFQVATIEVVKM